MVKRLKLSGKIMRDAKPAAGNSYQIFDTEILGLAAKVQSSGSLPGWWQGAPQGTHVRRWRADLGLSEDRILEVATETRRDHPEPPDGPKALDRAMERAARRQTGHGTAASRPRESTGGVGSGKSASSGVTPSAEAKAAFYAEMIEVVPVFRPVLCRAALWLEVCIMRQVSGQVSG